MPKIEIHGVRLHYEEYGKGSPLVFIHGLGGTIFDWTNQIPFFSKTHRVVALEMRDHGESDRWTGPYDMKMFSEDVAEFVGRLNLGEAVFFGISMGGMIVMQLALDHPEMVKALVLADTEPGMSKETAEAGLEMVSMSQKMTGEELSKATMKFNFTPEFMEAHPDIIAQAIRISDARDPSSTFLAAKGLMEFDVKKRLKEIKVPTLVANGEDDKLVPVSMAKYLKSHIKGAWLLVLPKGRHMAIIEKADEFNRVVLKFLKEIET